MAHNIPTRFKGATINDLEAPLLDRFRDWYGSLRWDDGRINTYENVVLGRITGDNLLLTGPVGAGKTHAAVAVGRRVEEVFGNMLRERAGYDLALHLAYWSTPELLRKLRDFDEADYLRDRLRVTGLVIIDDVGSHNNTDFAREQLFEVYDTRIRENLPTISIVNMTEDALESALGVATTSRMADHHIIKMDGANLRRLEVPEPLYAGTFDK